MFVRICLVSVLFLPVQSYIWDLVENPNDYHPDTVYHQSNIEGTQPPCRVTTPDWASGRKDENHDKCFVGYDGDEHGIAMPFEVLVRDPLTESMVWAYTTSSAEVREKGVEVCVGSSCPTNKDLYVCASPEWGPGKLVFWAENDIDCLVSWDGRENTLSSGYQALLVEPAYEYRLQEMTYYLDDLEVLQDNPLHLAEATLVNNDDADQVITHTLTYSKTSTNEWQNGYGFVIGATMSVTAGIPLFGELGWEIGVEETFEYSYGESHSETLEISLQAEVTVPGQHTCEVSIEARQMVVDVPYDATVTVLFPDDSTTTQYITGIYEGLSVSQDTVVIDACVPN